MSKGHAESFESPKADSVHAGDHEEPISSRAENPAVPVESFPPAEWDFIESKGLAFPCERYWTCTAVLAKDIYVFGGFSKRNNASKFHGDFFRFDSELRQWFDLSEHRGPIPPPRHSATMVGYGNRIFMFGGCGEGQTALSDLWHYDITTNQWTKIKEEDHSPAPAAASAGAVSPLDAKQAAFKKGPPPSTTGRTLSRAMTSAAIGAGTGGKLVGSIGMKPGGPAPALTKDHWPLARYSHSAVVYNDSMYIYAGALQDWAKGRTVWKLDLTTLKWEELEVNKSFPLCPERRLGHIAGVHGQKMYIFGGLKGVKPTAEVWAYDLLEHRWSLIEPSNSPGPRKWHTGIVVGEQWIIHGGVSGEVPEPEAREEAFSFDFNSLNWTHQPMLSAKDENQPNDSHSGCLISTGFSDCLYLLFGRAKPVETPVLPDVFFFDLFRPSSHLQIDEDEGFLREAGRSLEERIVEFFGSKIEQLSERLAPMRYSYETDIVPSLTKYLAKVSAKISNAGGADGEGSVSEEDDKEDTASDNGKAVLKQIIEGLTDADRLFKGGDRGEEGRTASATSAFIAALSAALECTEDELTKFVEGATLPSRSLGVLKKMKATLEMFEKFRSQVTSEFILPAVELTQSGSDIPLTQASQAFVNQASESAGTYFQANEMLQDPNLQPKRRRTLEVKKIEAAKSLLFDMEEKVRGVLSIFKTTPLGDKISWECLSRFYEEKFVGIEADLASCKKAAAKQEKVLSFLDKVERERARARTDALAEFEEKRVLFVEKRALIAEELKDIVTAKLTSYAEVLQEERALLLEAELYRREAEETARRLADMKQSALKPRSKTVAQQVALSEVVVPVLNVLMEEHKEIFSDLETVIGGHCVVVAEDTARDVARFERLVDEAHTQLEKHLTVQENSLKMIQSRIQSKKDYMVMMNETAVSGGVEPFEEGKPEEVEAQIEQLELSLTNLHTEMESVRQNINELNELNNKLNADISVLKEVNEEEVFPPGCKMRQVLESGFDWENALNSALSNINESFDSWIISLAESSSRRGSPVKEPPTDEQHSGRVSGKHVPKPAPVKPHSRSSVASSGAASGKSSGSTSRVSESKTTTLSRRGSRAANQTTGEDWHPAASPRRSRNSSHHRAAK